MQRRIPFVYRFLHAFAPQLAEDLSNLDSGALPEGGMGVFITVGRQRPSATTCIGGRSPARPRKISTARRVSSVRANGPAR
jgi:hypothetical protein